jgi:hypothetical protein
MSDVGSALYVAMGAVLLIWLAGYGMFWINRQEVQNQRRAPKPDSKFRLRTKRVCVAAWLLGHGTYALSWMLHQPQLEYLAWVFSGVFILTAAVLIGGAIRAWRAR